MKLEQIINNRKIEVIPKNIYKLVLIFGLLCFISGFFLSYVIMGYYINNLLGNLIYNNGFLIFEDKYYRFIEVYPTLNNLFYDNFTMI